MTKHQKKYSGPVYGLLLALLTLTPALANWLALWVLNDAWLGIVLCSVIFYGGAYWMIRVFGLSRVAKIQQGRLARSLACGLGSALAVAGTIISVGSVFFTRAIPGNMLQVCSQRLYLSQALRFSFWQFFLFVAVVLPVGEELYWRGGLQGLLRTRFTKTRMVLLSSLLFTIYHLVTVGFLMPGWPGLPLVASVFLGGLLFAFLTEFTGNIWAAAICHGLGAWGATIYLIWKFLR